MSGGAGECEGKGEDEVTSAWEQGQLRGRLLCLTFLADKGILVEVEKHMCRAAAGLPLGELGLGRGKIKDSWQSLDELSVYADQLAAEPGRQYRTPTVLGIEVEGKVSVAEEVDVDRVALPSKGAVLDVADLLTGSGLRRAYEDPDSIRLADTAQKPFMGRSCDRLPSAQRAAFARQLDKAGMLHVIGGRDGYGWWCVRRT